MDRVSSRPGGQLLPAEYHLDMTLLEAPERHQDLINELIAEVAEYNPDLDRDLIARAFRYAASAHEGQQRRSGEEFIHHPYSVARICAELQLDDETIAAALLHDVVEDTDVSLDDVKAEFGDEIAQLVDGVTKLTRVSFQSREQAQAENYRKMVLAMAEDLRVIFIKLADRLHNLRTIEYLGKQKQVQKAREALEVYAPLAHRLGIHQMKWELEDLAFEALHPRKYTEIKAMVNERRADREEHVREAAYVLQRELDKVDIPADISGRAKHFYSIYDKMAKKGKEFNEIYDLTAMRVIVERSAEEGTRDCYGALGLIHSLWKPMPGRFKDHIAMPKLNGYRALHTTVIGPQGRPLEIQVRTKEMHETAELGVAAHWLYKRGGKGRKPDERWLAWVRQLRDWNDESDPREYKKSMLGDLFVDEVYVYTPKGEVKMLPGGLDADRLRLRRAHGRRPQDSRRTRERPDRAAALLAPERRLRRGPDDQERARPVTRLADAREVVPGAEQDPAMVLPRDARGHGATRPGVPRAGAEAAEAAVQKDRRLRRARPGDPGGGLQEGGGLLPRARLRKAPSESDRQQGHPAPEDDRGSGRGHRSAQADALGGGGRELPSSESTSKASRTSSSASRSAARRYRATRSSATSRWARGSRSIGRTARTSGRCAATPSASRR